jgi:hypothetical protein
MPSSKVIATFFLLLFCAFMSEYHHTHFIAQKQSAVPCLNLTQFLYCIALWSWRNHWTSLGLSFLSMKWELNIFYLRIVQRLKYRRLWKMKRLSKYVTIYGLNWILCLASLLMACKLIQWFNFYKLLNNNHLKKLIWQYIFSNFLIKKKSFLVLLSHLPLLHLDFPRINLWPFKSSLSNILFCPIGRNRKEMEIMTLSHWACLESLSFMRWLGSHWGITCRQKISFSWFSYWWFLLSLKTQCSAEGMYS